MSGIFAAMLLGGTLQLQAEKVYTIYPVPQSQVAGVGNGAFTSEVNIVVESGVDATTLGRLKNILSGQGIAAEVTSAARKGVTNIFWASTVRMK